jgi:hypothetical protein
LNHLKKEAFLDEERLQHHNNSLASEFRLRFGPDDINFLILNSESEIDDFIRSVEDIKNGFDQTSLRRLTSRILTKERIIKDF